MLLLRECYVALPSHGCYFLKMSFYIRTLLVALFFFLPQATMACSCKWEAGSFNLDSTSGDPNFKLITLQQTYNNPPVVIVYATSQGGHGCHIRIRDVTTNSFYMAQVEPDSWDGRHTGMTNMHYIAMEPGNCVMPDGTKVEAGHISTDRFQNKFDPGNSAWNAVSFTSGFTAAPVLLHQIQTMNNETNITVVPGPNAPFPPSVPWFSEAVTNISSTGADVALELSEQNQPPTSALEQIGYIAIDPISGGSFTTNGGTAIDFDAFATGNVVDGWDNGCDTINFPTINSATRIALWSKRDRLDADGGWPRRCNINNTQIGLTMDEDRANDNERSHPAEPVSVLVFNQTFVDDTCDTDLFVQKRAYTDSSCSTLVTAPVNEGDTVYYCITVENLGPGAATSVVLEDVLPAGTTCEDVDSGGTGSTSTVPPTAGCP